MPCVAREQTKNCTGTWYMSSLHGTWSANATVFYARARYTTCRHNVHDVHMFDIVHERCAKFNTRRMARMGILYYILYYINNYGNYTVFKTRKYKENQKTDS